MKICHITNYLLGYHRSSGGAEQACLNTIKALYTQGVENIVAATKPLKQPMEKEFDFYSVTISEDLLGWKLSFIKRIFYFDFLSFFSLRKILKKTKPGIVHLYNFDLISLSAISAAKSLKIPVVFSVYDYWVFSTDKGITFNDSWMRRKIFNHFIKKIDVLIVLSNHSKKLLEEGGIKENKIKIVPLLMTDEKEKMSQTAQDKNLIVFLGWIQPRKGLRVLVEALPEIAEKNPKARLCVLGMKEDQSYLNGIIDFIKENKLEKNIIWRRNTTKTNNPAEYYDKMGKAAIVAVPEQWPNMSPVIIAESLAAGKVVVASRLGGIPDIIEDGVSGLLASYDNPNDFADKIIKALSDDNLSANISAGAVKRYEEIFDNNKNTIKIIKIYESLI